MFVQNYISLLPRRLERLRLGLTTGDLNGSMDAILSLRTSSQMVGAERLADLAWYLEQSLRQEAGQEARDAVLPQLAVIHLRPIRKNARQTAYLLQHYLHARPTRYIPELPSTTKAVL